MIGGERSLQDRQHLLLEHSSPGQITEWIAPGGPGVRVDTHVIDGYKVPPNYDSMIGKLIVHDATREQALTRMHRALTEFQVGPIKTTIPLQARLMRDKGFAEGGVDIHYLERLLRD